MPTVSQLWIYPIKSCGGTMVSHAALEQCGLRGDRRFMVSDTQGTFLTGRTEPRLLSVRVRFLAPDHPTKGYLLSAPGQREFMLPFSVEPRNHLREPTRVWRDDVPAVVHEEGSQWFSQYLDDEVRLVYQPDDALRPVNPRRAQTGDVVSLADGYPLLLCSESSLSDLNGRLDVPVPITRFRPNVVVEGSEAFAEDCWSRITIGGLSFDAPKLCDRCVMTTIDPSQGASSKEPLRTLARYRRWDNSVWFGTNLIPKSEGVLEIGASVEVLEERPHPRLSPPL